MARHRWIGAAGVLALVVLAAACSSSSDKSQGNSSTTVSTPGGQAGVTVTQPDGTPVTTPDGTPVTIAPGFVAVTTPNGTPVTRPDGSVVTTPASGSNGGGPGGTTVPPPTPRRWKLALDYRTHPEQNPFPNYSGGPPVWTLMQTASLAPGNYTKLPTYAPSFGAGIVAWHGASTTCGGLPAIGVAIVGPARICTATIQPSTAFLSPDASHMAVVAWKSPRTTNISIQTGMADFDPTCGDGVSYAIDRGTTTLTSGTLANGGSKQLPALQTHVNAGDTVYFMVGPGPSGNADCDATQLAVTIDPV
jgi:hypothetical protein